MTGPAVGTSLELPKPAGPFAVGVTDAQFLDPAQEALFRSETRRKLMVRLWYPAAPSDAPRRPYMTLQEYNLFGENARKVMPFPEAFEEPQRHAMMHARQDAPVADGTFALLIFSHGAFAHVNSNVAQMEHLASHGYIVASVAHPGLSGAVIYPDGEVATLDPDIAAGYTTGTIVPTMMAAWGEDTIEARLAAQRKMAGDFPLTPHFRQWRDDLIATADAIVEGRLGDHAATVAACADLDRLGYFGMSFGSAAVAAAHLDTRARAAFNLDGANLDPALIDAEVRVPTAILHGDMSLVFGPIMPGKVAHPHSQFNYEALATIGTRADVVRREVAGAAHIDFTDRSLFPAAIRDQQTQFGLAGTIAGTRVHEIMNAYLLAFFDRYVRGTESAFPADIDSRFTEVSTVDLDVVRAWTRDRAA
jgi:predicted dienelactone hydrolase